MSFVLSGIYARAHSLELFVNVNCGNVGMEIVSMVSLPLLELQTVICPHRFSGTRLGPVQMSHYRSPLPAHCPGLENVTTYSKVCVCSIFFPPAELKNNREGENKEGRREEAVKHIESPKFMCPIFQPCWSQFTPVI